MVGGLVVSVINHINDPIGETLLSTVCILLYVRKLTVSSVKLRQRNRRKLKKVNGFTKAAQALYLALQLFLLLSSTINDH